MTHIITTTLSEALYVRGRSASSIQTNGISVEAGVYTIDFSAGNNFNITLGATSILGQPINGIAGQSGVIFIAQDPINGGETMSFDSSWHFPNGSVPSLSSSAGAVDALVFMVRQGGASPIISAQLVLSV